MLRAQLLGSCLLTLTGLAFVACSDDAVTPPDEPDGSVVERDSGAEDAGTDAALPVDAAEPDASDAGVIDAGPALTAGELAFVARVDATHGKLRFGDGIAEPVDLSAAFGEEAAVHASSNGKHFAIEEAGHIYAGDVRADGMASDVSGAPITPVTEPIMRPIRALDDGGVLYYGEYAEAGKVDVFRDGTRLSTTAASRTDVVDGASYTLDSRNGTLLWTHAAITARTFVVWPGATVETALPDALGEDNVLSPDGKCVGFGADHLQGPYQALTCQGQANVVQLTAPGNGTGDVFWHPQSQRLAVRSYGDDLLHVASLASGNWTLSPALSPISSYLAVPPSGAQHVAFENTTDALKVLDLSQPVADYAAVTRPLTVPSGFTVVNALYSNDGGQLVASSVNQIIKVGSSEATPLATLSGLAIASMQWSPDDSHLLVAARAGNARRLVVVDVATGTTTTLRTGTAPLTAAKWIAADRIAFLNQSGELHVVNADNSSTIGTPYATSVAELLSPVLGFEQL